MISMKRATLAAALSTLFLAAPALANQTYVCTHGDKQRVISVVYATEGQTVPCEVTYDKGMGAESLWQAQNLAGYCEEQAAAFVEKQRGWGWTCTQQ